MRLCNSARSADSARNGEVHHAQSQNDPLVYIRALADIVGFVGQHLKEKDSMQMRLHTSTFNVRENGTTLSGLQERDMCAA
jgi:hypothetical protein